MTRRLRLPIVVFLLLAGVAPVVRAGAGRSRRWPATAAGRLAGSRRRSDGSPSASSRRRRRPSGWPRATFRALGQATQLTKGENGVWEITVGPIDPGSYRYNFNVDGVTTIDPRNPFISESNNNVWSLVYVPGSEFTDTRERAARRGRRGHLLLDRAEDLPPHARLHAAGLRDADSDKYPVFYLLHGAGDSDDSWISVGRAGFILDNLIAAKKAKPMIVVMPAGHTRRGPAAPGVEVTRAGPRPGAGRSISAAARRGEPLENALTVLKGHGSGITDDDQRRRALSLDGDPDQALAVLIGVIHHIDERAFTRQFALADRGVSRSCPARRHADRRRPAHPRLLHHRRVDNRRVRPIARVHSVDNVVTVCSLHALMAWWPQSRPAASGSVIRTIRIRHSLSDWLPSR